MYSFQLKYQMKKFWLKASVLNEQLLGSAPYAIAYLCSLYSEQSIWSEIDFKFKRFSPLKLFFRAFSLSANLV